MTGQKPGQVFRKYAVPQMVGLLFNSMYFIVDGVFIGNRLGREALAAAAVAVPVLEVLIALSMALTAGAGVLISHSLGRGEAGPARRVFKLSLLLALLTGLLLSLTGALGTAPLVLALGAQPAFYTEAFTYLQVILLGAPFLVFSFLLGGLARNDGRPRLAMAAMALGALTNIVLDYVFMYPLNLGIRGAALATALGPVVSVLMLLPHFIMKRGRLYLVRAGLVLKETGQVLALGFPAFIMEFTIGLVTLFYNWAIVRAGHGELGLAAFLLMGYLMLMLLIVFLGLAEGLQPVFAFLLGAGEFSQLRAVRRYAQKALLFTGLLACALITLFSAHFYRLFAPGDTVLVGFAAGSSRLFFPGLFIAGFNILMIVYWQSAGKPGQALTVSLLRSLMLPPLLLFLLPGGNFLWLALGFSELLTAALAAYWLYRSARRPLALSKTA